uniref:Uncharacterized protein n=2 Tax=Human herpesvirus 2 TaxID=10310 RepID=A0A481TS88_HHV2|nr:hypothetical protein [Human alphaherpesvirus 2]
MGPRVLRPSRCQGRRREGRRGRGVMVRRPVVRLRNGGLGLLGRGYGLGFGDAVSILFDLGRRGD